MVGIVYETQGMVDRWITTEVTEKMLEKLDGTDMQNLTLNRRGGNPPSTLMLLPFKFDFKLQSNNETRKRKFLAKLVPANTNNDFQQIFRGTLKQDAAVTEILKEINILLSPSENTFRFPDLYYSKVDEPGKEILVFEDMISKGYLLNDYCTPMSLDSSILVMEAYARLHAGSLLLHSEQRLNVPSDLVTVNEECFRSIEASLKGMLDAHIFLLERSDEQNKQKFIDWINHKKANILSLVKDVFKPSDRFNVLTHGSIGENLIYFGKGNRRRLEVCLSSWGGAKMASPAVDLNNFFFVCLNTVERENQKAALLRLYYDLFTDILNRGNVTLPFTFLHLEREVENKSLAGFFAGMMSLPRYTGGPDFTNDLSLFNSAGMNRYIAEHSRYLNILYEENEYFKSRFFEMYKDLVIFNVT